MPSKFALRSSINCPSLLAFIAATLLLVPVTNADTKHTLLKTTPIGGSQFDVARDVQSDAAGNIYITGGTKSANFPCMGQAYHQVGVGGYYDVFLAKFSPRLKMLWCYVIGGPGYDRAYALDISANGDIFISGRAGAQFPVTANSIDPQFDGGTEDPLYGSQDPFALKAKQTSSGLQFEWITYLGGNNATNDDGSPARDIAAYFDPVAQSYGAYVFTAVRDSTTVMSAKITAALTNSFHGGTTGLDDIVVVKIKPDGTAADWATFVGGSDFECHTGSIVVDGNGDPVLLTTTRSTDVATGNTYNSILHGVSDFLVAKLRKADGSLAWATLVGGNGQEGVETHSIAINKATDDIIGIGMTESTDFPTTSGAFQQHYGGPGGTGTGKNTNYSGDGVVFVLSNTGAQLKAGSYIGGSVGDAAEGVWFAGGSIFIAGATYSSNFPTTASAYSKTIKGKTDAFFVRLSPSLALQYSTLIGGVSDDWGRSISANNSGKKIYLVGQSNSSNFPDNVPYFSYGGNWDAIATVFVK